MERTSGQRQKKIEQAVSARQRGIIVVLEDLHDPHNIAAILRTCDAFGIQEIACVYEKEKYVNPRRVGKSSSSSANKWLNFSIYHSSTDCIQALKDKNYRLLVTALDTNVKSLYDTDLAIEPIAVVFGNEHGGVSPMMLEASDQTIFIPMQGMVQSLNVSVTAAVCISELSRQRQKSGKDFSLSGKEKEALMKDFLER